MLNKAVMQQLISIQNQLESVQSTSPQPPAGTYTSTGLAPQRAARIRNKDKRSPREVLEDFIGDALPQNEEEEEDEVMRIGLDREFVHLGSGNEFSLNVYREKCREADELTHLNDTLRIKLRQAESDASRLSKRLETEEQERKRVELKNAELNVQFNEAKQGLRDTQAALLSVQQAVDQRQSKTEQRDIQVQRLAAENNLLEARIYEAEAKCRDAEKDFRSYVADRDDAISRLQEQLSNSQDASFKLQSDLTRVKGESMLHATELEIARRKIFSLELKGSQTEQSMQTAHKQEIEILENKIAILSNKVAALGEHEDHVDGLREELRLKIEELQNAHDLLHQATQERMDLEAKVAAAERQVHLQDMRCLQLESRAKQLELEPSKKDGEIEILRRQLQFLEQTIQDQERQQNYFVSLKAEYTNTIAVQAKSLESLVDVKVKYSRQQRENERLNAQLDELHSKLHEVERKNRMLGEDLVHAENYIAELSSKFSSQGDKQDESRQALLLANERIMSLYGYAQDLQAQLLSSHHSASPSTSPRTTSMTNGSMSFALLFPAPPTVPLPLFMDRPDSLVTKGLDLSKQDNLVAAITPVSLGLAPKDHSPPASPPTSPLNTAATPSKSLYDLSDTESEAAMCSPVKSSSRSKSPLALILEKRFTKGDEYTTAKRFMSSIMRLFVDPSSPIPEEDEAEKDDEQIGEWEVGENAAAVQEEPDNVVYRLAPAVALRSSESMREFQQASELQYTDLSMRDPVIKCFHEVLRQTTDSRIISSALRSCLVGCYEELAVDAVLRATIIIGHLSRSSRNEGQVADNVSTFLSSFDPEVLLRLIDRFGHNAVFLSKTFYILLTITDFNTMDPLVVPKMTDVVALLVKHPTDVAMQSGCFQLLLALVRSNAIVHQRWDWAIFTELVERYKSNEGIVAGCFSVLLAGAELMHDVDSARMLELQRHIMHQDNITRGVFGVLQILVTRRMTVSASQVCQLVLHAQEEQPQRELVTKECILLLYRLVEVGQPVSSEHVMELIQRFHMQSFGSDLVGLLRFLAQKDRNSVRLERIVSLVRYASVYRPPDDAHLRELLVQLYDVLLVIFRSRADEGQGDSAAAAIEDKEGLLALTRSFLFLGGHDVVMHHISPESSTSSDGVIVLKSLTLMNALCRGSENADRLGSDTGCMHLSGLLRAFNTDTKIMEQALILVSALCLESTDQVVQDSLRLAGVVSNVVNSMLNNGGRTQEVIEREFYLHCRAVINLCVRENRSNMDAFAEKVKSFCFLLRFVQYQASLLEQLVLAILAVIGHNKANHVRFLDGGICDTLHEMLIVDTKYPQEMVSPSQLVVLWALSKIAMATDMESSDVNVRIKATLRKIVQSPGNVPYSESVKVSALTLLRNKFFDDGAVLTQAQEQSLISKSAAQFSHLFIDAGMRSFRQQEEVRREKVAAAQRARRREEKKRAIEELERKEAEEKSRLLLEKQAEEMRGRVRSSTLSVIARSTVQDLLLNSVAGRRAAACAPQLSPQASLARSVVADLIGRSPSPTK